MKRLIGLAMALMMTGCVATGPSFEAAPAPANNQALVYVYRVSNLAFSARRSQFFVDKVKFADLNEQGYTRIYVPAGAHVLMQKWPWDVAPRKSTHLNAYWQAGGTYYYNLESWVAGNTINWRIAQISPAVGGQQIASYRYQPPINGEPLR